MEVQIKQEPNDNDDGSLFMECHNETHSENYSDMVVKTEHPDIQNPLQNFENDVDDNDSNTVYTVTIDRRKGYPKKLNPQMYTQSIDIGEEEEETNLTQTVPVGGNLSSKRSKKTKTQKIVEAQCEHEYKFQHDGKDEAVLQIANNSKDLSNEEEVEGDAASVECVSEHSDLISDGLETLQKTQTIIGLNKKKSKPTKLRIKFNKDKSSAEVVNEFPCNQCGKMFYRKKNLTTHLKIHIGIKNYICEYCGKSFLTSKCLRRHERIHTGVRPYKCEICGNGFICWSAKNVHMRTHTGLKPYKCEFCGKDFASKMGLNTHVANHTGNKPFPCPQCTKAFPSRRDMNKHMKTHSDVRPYVCKLCGKGFKRADSLTEHEYRHSGEQPHVCDLCGKGFYNVHKLKKHLLAHDGPDQMSRCIQCNKLFPDKEALKEHKKEHVSQQEMCGVCGKMMANQVCLKRHLRLHSGQKPYECDQCGKLFTQMNNMNRHKLCHTGERPYACKTCGRKFTQSGTLKAHVRLHTGERPFVCSICGKGFAQASNLKSHESKHVGKPFSCDVCGKSFVQQSSLKAHAKRHENQTLKSYDESEATDWFMMQASKLDESLTTNDTKTF